MKLPTIGELNRRIQITRINHEPVQETNVQVNAVPVGKIWAKLEPVGGLTYWSSINVNETTTHRIYVRRVEGKTSPEALANITEITCDGILYGVRRVSDVMGARRFTLIEVQELGVAADVNEV